MPLIVQDDTGTVSGANSYVSLADFKSYWILRGALFTGLEDAELEAALIVARQYLDTRWDYIGAPLDKAQTTSWPRSDIKLSDGSSLTVVPQLIKEAQFEYASLATRGPLWPVRLADPTGAIVSKRREKVDKIEEEVEYAQQGLALTAPSYGYPDTLIRRSGYIRFRKNLLRA